MRRPIALTLLISLCLLATSARADLRRADPDDSDGLDISFAASAVSGSPVKLRFGVRFHEAIDWDKKPGIFILIDSKAGPQGDYLLQVRLVEAGYQCRLTNTHGEYVARLQPPDVRATAVACRFRRSLIRRDGTPIRWGVSALYYRGPLIPSDDAPDRGLFPHA